MTAVLMRSIFIALMVCFALPLHADSLDQMSFRELAQFVQQKATDKDLTAIAQRQFYFEVDSDFAEQAAGYARMQEAIAEKIPNEFSRPVFDVRFIFGDKNEIKLEQTLGILGGTGPLSDANITKLVIDRIQSHDLSRSAMIHLFSLPPPRTTKDQIFGGVLYSARLTKFLRRGYASYFLASNTAHLNIGTLQTLSGSDRIQNLPKMIADQIGPETLLILGTKQAWEGRLYASIFDAKGMPYVRPNLDDQNELQKWIDRVKAGRLSGQEQIQLKNFVAELGRKSDVKVLLLSCTELPLGLGVLLDELREEGFTIYDSEVMIADIIAQEWDRLP